MKKTLLLFFILLFGAISSIYATHNRAGEITYQHISGNTYKITVTTYTNTNPATTQADRCELTVYFGDGDSATAPRVNGLHILCPSTADGESIGNDTKKNIYETIHSYSGAGSYIIRVEDPNRNAGICNIPNSVDQAFALHTELIINPWLGANSSPELLYPPIDRACVGACFEHNPGASDPDGDSLSYSLTVCHGSTGLPIGGYTLPPNMSSNAIDAITGDLVWCSPPMICQYNIAILIKEYRKSPLDNQWYYIGYVLRDMQIDVGSCSNTPPVIHTIDDTCIVANSTLTFPVNATDVDSDFITLTATGSPFLQTPAATFTTTPSISPTNGLFNWVPNCNQIQSQPYQVTFKATDNDSPIALVNFKSVFIRVIAPPPTGLTATPNGANMILNWNASSCSSVTNGNPLLGYRIYRKDSCDNWVPNACETGVPSYTGYTQIGTVTPNVLTFTDSNNGQGLAIGVDYSYIIVAYYADGSVSYASNSLCAHVVRDVPVITNVSVVSTGTNDSIWVRWVKPLAANLDTLTNLPPYEYRLFRAQGFNPPANSFAQIASYSQPAFYLLTDTSHISAAINTQDTSYTYRVDFYSNGNLLGSASTASSIYLKATPGDQQINLTWQEFVPWTNYRYYIYRETTNGSGNFTIIDSTTTNSYLDTGLVNGISYCYKIVSIGRYSDTSITHPLYNHSQIKCTTPIDMIPPCQPDFTIANDCNLFQNNLSWLNPNTYCSDDAIQYTIYFAPTTNSELELIYSSTDMSTTTYTHQYQYEGIPSVAGCYAVTAKDSTGNESPVVTKKCVDNCPMYELPNVFTPNDDGFNDFYSALPYKFVKDVDFKVYDRWGLLMFETTNPDILWDGKNTTTKKMCSDGTYFYICTVNEIRVDGITPRTLKGFIQLLQQKIETK